MTVVIVVFLREIALERTFTGFDADPCTHCCRISIAFDFDVQYAFGAGLDFTEDRNGHAESTDVNFAQFDARAMCFVSVAIFVVAVFVIVAIAIFMACLVTIFVVGMIVAIVVAGRQSDCQ